MTRPVDERVEEALAWLHKKGRKSVRDGMARYAIPADKALGVPMRDIQALAKVTGRDHALALALWKTDVYEARLLTAYVDEPEKVTPAQMDRWCRDFDNWAIGDTLTFALWDRTPHAWPMVTKWSTRRAEFEKRSAFALLAALALHDKAAPDAKFTAGLRMIERAAIDERNFVKKGVNWALRSIGRRNAKLHAAAVKLAQKLAASPEPAPRWIGKDALRELMNPKVAGKFRSAGSKRATQR